MANPDHVAIFLEADADPRNLRGDPRHINLDLRDLDLSGRRLRWVQILDSDFSRARLYGVSFFDCEFRGCKFDDANLERAYLGGSRFTNCSFMRANLNWADLASSQFTQSKFVDASLVRTNGAWASFRQAKFDGADLTTMILQNAELPYASMKNTKWRDVDIMHTVLAGADLSGAIDLEHAFFRGPAVIDHETIRRSGRLPKAFLRSCGLPDDLIDLFDTIPGAIFFHSVFISYSEKNTELARRLYADLQDGGVRCWFAPVSLAIGDRFRDEINEAIHFQDKLLLLLSADSIDSAWVQTEVETAFERERREHRSVLFPVRLDDSAMSTESAWAGEIRRTRHIGDFRSWRDDDAYKAAFETLLRDLKAPPP